VDLPFDSVEAVGSWFTQELPARDLVAYLDRFDVTTSVMQTKDALERIAFELVEDAAAENVWYMEVRYAPILSTKRGLSPRQVVDSVKQGLARGMEQ
jgi:adenosine deaminase